MPRILIVDDEPDILFVLRVTLEAAGFDVVEAADGAQAERAIALSAPDLIITDLMMPVVDGHELIRRLRADDATKSIPIVIVSAKPVQPGEADVVLRKPWRTEDLLRSVTELLPAISD